MKTMQKEDHLSRAAERVSREYYEKFKRETLELARREHEAKERKKKEAEKAAESGDRP